MEPCDKCGKGTYKRTAGQHACSQCGGGNSTVREGAVSHKECVSICGDGLLSLWEGCDDGNLAGGDGCSAECMVERGFECRGGGPKGPAQDCSRDGIGNNGKNMKQPGVGGRVGMCGDGVRDEVEECDDGNRRAGDGCTLSCKIESGWLCAKGTGFNGTDKCTRAKMDRAAGSHEAGKGKRKLPKPPPPGKSPLGRGGSGEFGGQGGHGAGGEGGPGKPEGWLPTIDDLLEDPVWKKTIERDMAGCKTDVQVLERLMKLYGVPEDREQTAAQFSALGCFSVEHCINKIMEKIYISRWGEQVCKKRLGYGGEHDGRGGCKCSRGLEMDEGRCLTRSVGKLGASGGGTGDGDAVDVFEAAELEMLDVKTKTCVSALGGGATWEGGSCVCRPVPGGGEKLGCEASVSIPDIGRNASESKTLAEARRRGSAKVGVGSLMEEVNAEDARCRRDMRSNYESDFEGGCSCSPGYTTDLSDDGSECVQGSTKACRLAFGDNVEFDGRNSCRCKAGHTVSNGACVPGTNAACRATDLGKNAMFDGVRSCRCKHGYTHDVSGTCEPGTDAACASSFGSLAEFDGVANCVCKRRSVVTANSSCAPGSDALCRSITGSPRAYFDGANSCACGEGELRLGQRCVKGDLAVCQRMHGAGAHYDGYSQQCACARGMVMDRSGACVSAKGKACTRMLGKHGEYDGVANSCRCSRGYTADLDGWCVKGSDQVCARVFGPGVVFDQASSCKCPGGFIFYKGRCLHVGQSLCEAMQGDKAVYEREKQTCGCQPGYTLDLGMQMCVLGSSTACTSRYGSGWAFNGENCACAQGRVRVNGTCVAGSQSACDAAMGEASVYIPLVGCRCREGYTADATGVCEVGSDALCQSRMGDSSMFDGFNNCTCAARYSPDSTGFCVASAPPADAAAANAAGAAAPEALTAKTLAGIRAQFDEYDSDSDAGLSVDECKGVSKRGATHLTPLCTAFVDSDIDGDGVVDFGEALTFLSPTAAAARKLNGGQGPQPGWQDNECKLALGKGAVSDGKGGCACGDGYHQGEGGCVQGEAPVAEGGDMNAQCQSMFGPGSFFDGEMCDCLAGYHVDQATNQCVEKKRRRSKKDKKNKSQGAGKTADQLEAERLQREAERRESEAKFAPEAAEARHAADKVKSNEEEAVQRAREAQNRQKVEDAARRASEETEKLADGAGVTESEKGVEGMAPGVGVGGAEHGRGSEDGIHHHHHHQQQQRQQQLAEERGESQETTGLLADRLKRRRASEREKKESKFERLSREMSERNEDAAANAAGDETGAGPDEASKVETQHKGTLEARGEGQSEGESKSEGGGKGEGQGRGGANLGAGQGQDEAEARGGQQSAASEGEGKSEGEGEGEGQQSAASEGGAAAGHVEVQKTSAADAKPGGDAGSQGGEPAKKNDAGDEPPQKQAGGGKVSLKEGGGEAEDEAARQEKIKAREERRKKREAERRWKQYFGENAMDAIKVQEKAKAAAEAASKFKKLDMADDDASSSSTKIEGGDGEVAGASPTEASPKSEEPEKPAPLSEEEFARKLAELTSKRSSKIETASETGDTKAAEGEKVPHPGTDAAPAASLRTEGASEAAGGNQETAPSDAGAKPAPGGEAKPKQAAESQPGPSKGSEASPRDGKPAGGEQPEGGGIAVPVSDADRFCIKLQGEHARYDDASGGCVCMHGWKEDSKGDCSLPTQ